MAENQGIRPHAGNNAPAQNSAGVPPASAVVNPPFAAPCSDKEPCYTKDAAAEKLPPHWRRPEWIIVDVTVIYVIISAFTLWAIKRQADLLEKQNAHAINRARAEMKIEPESMAVDIDQPNFWFMHSKIKIRNVGIGSAYIVGANATMSLRFDREKPKLQRYGNNNLKIVGEIVPANTPRESPHPEEIIYLVENLTMAEQAEMIFPGKVVPYISGFIEYKTEGTIFRQNTSTRAICSEEAGQRNRRGRELRSHNASRPPSRYRLTHLDAVWRLTLCSAAASHRPSRPSTTSLAKSSRPRTVSAA